MIPNGQVGKTYNYHDALHSLLSKATKLEAVVMLPIDLNTAIQKAYCFALLSLIYTKDCGRVGGISRQECLQIMCNALLTVLQQYANFICAHKQFNCSHNENY